MGLRLRSGPGAEHDEITILVYETLVDILQEQNGWYNVEADGHTGFVSAEYVSLLGEATAPSHTVSASMAGSNLAPPAHQILTMPAGAVGLTKQVINTWNQFGGALLNQADRLGIDPDIALAVLLAESAGEPFGSDGRMIIRFENHIFYNYWGKQNEATYRQHFTFTPGESWKGHQWRPSPNVGWSNFHGNQQTEWQVFEFARQLDEKAAIYAISMGAPQIMGFNHQRIGYSSPQEMFQAFQLNADAQIASLFRFMEVNNLVDAIRSCDFRAFAQVYNGPGQADHYGNIIQERFQACQQLRGPLAPASPVAPAMPIVPASPSSPSSPEVGKQVPLAPAMPMPIGGTEKEGKPPLSETDPELYQAWVAHIKNGFENNEVMFNSILRSIMTPYNTTIWMYRILFGVGILSFLFAAGFSAYTGNIMFGLVFGGLSVGAFLSYFLGKPLQALEENLQFITWLGIIYNTYWNRLVYSMDQETVHTDIKDATAEAIRDIDRLIDKHAAASGKRAKLDS